LDVSKLISKEPQVQEFIRKITKIIALFLKDQTAPKELHRSALKFIKVAITYLDFNTDPTLTNILLSPVFQLKTCRRYSMTLRRIITKLIIRVGDAKVKAATPKEHLSLVNYVERARRKKLHLRERAKMLALLGKKQTVVDKKGLESEDSDSDPEMGKADDSQSDDSDESSDSDDEQTGTDALQSSLRLDIPIVRDIPILSQLAKKEKTPKKEIKKVTEVMETEDVELETHFVENPFIRVRERASKK
jgi:hypothetical protein